MHTRVIPFLMFCGVAALTAVLVWLWIRVSVRARILDVPTHRSSHVKVTPRGGGVGIVVGVLSGLAVFALMGMVDGGVVVRFAGLAVVIAGVSLVDDVRPLPSLVRLVFHVGVAVGAVESFGAWRAFAFPQVEAGLWSMALGYTLAVVWLVGITNVYNFMDGIDGIAGGQGVIAGLAWAVVGGFLHDATVGCLGLALAAACTGFLLLNWAPARVFMGDVGSAFLGFSFGCLPLLLARYAPESPAVMAGAGGAISVFGGLVVWPFLADGSFTLSRRIRRRENILAAHRSHLYQRLTIAGWSHGRVALLYIGWAAFSSLLGLSYLRGGAEVRVAVLSGALATLTMVWALVRYREKRVAALATFSSGNAALTAHAPLDPASQRSPCVSHRLGT